MRKIAILGATGSVGRQCLDVIRENPAEWEVVLLSAYKNDELLSQYSLEFPSAKTVNAKNAELLACPETYEGADIVFNAIGGMAGLKPTFAVAESGAILATANKESIVSAGELLKKEYQGVILPVDSEHSALFQCMQGETAPKKLVLTASGGPFRTWEKERIATVTAEDALRHPTWKMGKKVTVDSASMMNKGFEVIEAKRLFGDYPVEVLVHPESVVHALVQFADGIYKAILSAPDMKDPIRYALGYPNRRNHANDLNFERYSALHFEQPNFEKFPALSLAVEAERGGDYVGTVLSAADEVAVELFLNGKVSFYGMSDLVADAVRYFGQGKIRDLSDVLRMEREVKEYTLTKAQAGGFGCF